MYQGLTPEICQTAWTITLGSVTNANNLDVANKFAGTIVVCYPRTHASERIAVVFATDIDPSSPNATKYEDIAIAKAKVSWETGLPSRKVQQDAPHLYRLGMTKWGDSVVENGLIVAFSGVQAVFDEAIAGTMLRWIVALCQNEMTREGGVMEADTNFIGE